MNQPSNLPAMTYDDVVLGRRSIRGFTDEPVPRELIREVLELAMRAPSSLNTQPWNFYVVTGEPLDRIRAGTFRTIGQLNPMGNGWQTRGVNALTHSVTETTARYFRLVYTPGPPLGYDEGMRTGTRTGGGDFPNMIEPLGFASILLSSTPAVHHLPCKNMTTWGWSRLATDAETPPSACVPIAGIVDLTSKLQDDGTIENWTPPGPGLWRVQRIGCVSQLSSDGSFSKLDSSIWPSF